MARVQLYERAVVIHTLDIEIQDGAKIKEEPADTTSNTDATKDSMLVRNCFSLIDHDYHCDESSLPKKDTLYKDINNTDINNTENGHSSNDDSVHSNDVNKTVNIAHTSAKPKEEIHNTLLQFNKQGCYNEVSNNKNTSVLRTTTKNVKGKRKSKRRRETPSECNVCFRTFSSGRNYAYHLRYFSYSDNNICRFCNRHYVTKGLLQTHVCLPDVCKNTYRYKCHFCTRTFRKKVLLQSHVFHMHGELIDCNNEIKHKTSKSKNVNTPPEDDTLRTGANGESYSNNLREDNFKSEKINTTLTNNVNKLPNNEISPTTKRLRQPTLTEYLELCKKKRDIKLSPNKLNFVKNDSLKSDNLPKQTAPSTLEQTTVKHETPKKPFVRLHADFEMMKSFLENLSDTVVKDKRPNLLTKNRRSNTVLYDREVPYRLRSLGGHFSMEIDQNIGIRRRNRTRVNIELKRKQNAIDEADKVDPEVDLKIVRARFKCKECTIPLTRCDERSRNSYQISTIDTMKNTSLTTQCNSTLVEESDAGNNMALKDLEVSVERLISVPNIKIKTELDVETHNNNCFLCKVCKETFSSRLDRHVHIKSSHIAYMSSICDARYTQKHKLLQHYLSEHLFKQNQCCICYMLLPDYEALKQHLNVHCLKYIQRGDDKYPIDIELKCDLIKKSLKCLHCNQKFSSQSSLEAHQSCCIVQEEMEKDQQDSTEEASAHPNDIPEIQHGINTDEIILTCDEIFNPDDSSKTLNSDCVEEKSNEHQTLLHSEKEPEVNEANRNVLVNNNLSEEKIENVNKSQDSKKLSENNNSAISNQNTANTQLDDTTRTMTYPCDKCGKQFHNPKNLEIHIRSFSFSTDICPMCGTGFSSKRLLQTHIAAAHVQQISQTYSFHCVFCNQGFLKKHDLRPHILHLHSQQVLNTLACNYNVSQEKSDKSSVIHTKMCNVCNLVFETNDRYVEHRMYYYKNHTFTCSLCAQNFQGLYMFNHHTKLIHYSEEKRKAYSYICEICNEGFNHENHFYSHNMHVHSNDLVETAKEERNSNVQEKIGNSSTDQQKQNKQLSNEYTCEICQLKCIDINDMVKHRELYSNDGDFSCDKCKRRCRTIHLLDQHRKSTHLYRNIYNGHACHVCDEVLETVTALNCHEKHFHSNITDNNTDNLKNCDGMSSSNITSKITEHPRKSKNDTCTVTKYNCVFCNMKFPTANTVQTHIVHVHMDDMIAKRAILKLTLPIVNNDDIQKQLLEADPATSVASTSSGSTSSASTSEDNSTQLLQRPMIQRPVCYKLLGNPTAKNTIKKYDRATIELLKRAARSKINKISEKTSIPAIPCINKSKDISTVSTVAPNTESKTNTSVSLSTGPTTFRTIAPSKFGNNTSVLLSTGPTISKAIVTNTESKDNTSVPPSGSTNDLQKSSDVSLKSGSMNELEANSISSANRCITNKSKPEPSLTEPSPIFRRVMPEKCKSNEITNQKSESVNGYSYGYSCPLCPLEYPSLMFFHAHLNYAHADSIRTIEKRRNRERKVGVIECLLCPCNFTSEIKYKKHLRNSHTYYVYIPHSQERTKINNERNPLAIKTNINRKSTIPETITVDDVPETITVNDVPETITVNDDDNVKNTSDQQATEVTATPDHGRQNEKIGKLRVRSFAKIIENLSADSTLKL
ncbi:uncharacterized protein LOC143893253 [Temnothorax americanus]|uniref:uncharacterized protein LOC143893253 n=1 Tax=Temnothorax americanus TaxID=1964332 RepID=UPI004067B4ED